MLIMTPNGSTPLSSIGSIRVRSDVVHHSYNIEFRVLNDAPLTYTVDATSFPGIVARAEMDAHPEEVILLLMTECIAKREEYLRVRDHRDMLNATPRASLTLVVAHEFARMEAGTRIAPPSESPTPEGTPEGTPEESSIQS